MLNGGFEHDETQLALLCRGLDYLLVAVDFRSDYSPLQPPPGYRTRPSFTSTHQAPRPLQLHTNSSPAIPGLYSLGTAHPLEEGPRDELIRQLRRICSGRPPVATYLDEEAIIPLGLIPDLARLSGLWDAFEQAEAAQEVQDDDTSQVSDNEFDNISD